MEWRKVKLLLNCHCNCQFIKKSIFFFQLRSSNNLLLQYFFQSSFIRYLFYLFLYILYFLSFFCLCIFFLEVNPKICLLSPEKKNTNIWNLRLAYSNNSIFYLSLVVSSFFLSCSIISPISLILNPATLLPI